jgi:hypothetical protein
VVICLFIVTDKKPELQYKADTNRIDNEHQWDSYELCKPHVSEDIHT